MFSFFDVLFVFVFGESLFTPRDLTNLLKGKFEGSREISLSASKVLGIYSQMLEIGLDKVRSVALPDDLFCQFPHLVKKLENYGFFSKGEGDIKFTIFEEIEYYDMSHLFLDIFPAFLENYKLSKSLTEEFVKGILYCSFYVPEQENKLSEKIMFCETNPLLFLYFSNILTFLSKYKVLMEKYDVSRDCIENMCQCGKSCIKTLLDNTHEIFITSFCNFLRENPFNYPLLWTKKAKFDAVLEMLKISHETIKNFKKEFEEEVPKDFEEDFEEEVPEDFEEDFECFEEIKKKISKKKISKKIFRKDKK